MDSMMLNDSFIKDIHNALDVLEDYIISEENKLIETNAGDTEWCKLDKYKETLKNFQFISSIYG